MIFEPLQTRWEGFSLESQHVFHIFACIPEGTKNEAQNLPKLRPEALEKLFRKGLKNMCLDCYHLREVFNIMIIKKTAFKNYYNPKKSVLKIIIIFKNAAFPSSFGFGVVFFVHPVTIHTPAIR